MPPFYGAVLRVLGAFFPFLLTWPASHDLGLVASAGFLGRFFVAWPAPSGPLFPAEASFFAPPSPSNARVSPPLFRRACSPSKAANPTYPAPPMLSWKLSPASSGLWAFKSKQSNLQTLRTKPLIFR